MSQSCSRSWSHSSHRGLALSRQGAPLDLHVELLAPSSLPAPWSLQLQAGLWGPEPALDVMGVKLVQRHKALCAVVTLSSTQGMSHTRNGLPQDEQLQSVVPSQAEGGPVLTHNVVTDWDELEELWHRVLYQELGIWPKEVALLATAAPLSPTAKQDKVANLLSKDFGAPAMLVLPHSAHWLL